MNQKTMSRVWSMFPLTRVPFQVPMFDNHRQMEGKSEPAIRSNLGVLGQGFCFRAHCQARAPLQKL